MACASSLTSSNSCEPLFWCTRGWPRHPLLFLLMGSLKLHQIKLSFILISLLLSECAMLETDRKITNFTNHSMHSYASAICQFLFIFRCHSRLSWQRHKGLISQYLSPVSKIQRYCDVMTIIEFMPWKTEAAWKGMSTPSETPLHLNFTLNSAEGPVPEWVEPVVSVCHSRWTLSLLSACPAFLPSWSSLLFAALPQT